MAETQHSANTTPEVQAEREFTVRMSYTMDSWSYFGTRAQIEAEGVVPPDTKWPEGERWQQWKAGGLNFILRRTRPDGMKGPKRLWVIGDWWELRCDRAGGLDFFAQQIRVKNRELAAALYFQTPAGRREYHANWSGYHAAHEDKGFRAFRALIPALNPPPRSSKPSKRQA